MSAQPAQPDAAHLVPAARDFTGEIEHQAVLDGENQAHIAPGRGIQADCRVQVALCLSALDKLADKLINSAVMLTDTTSNIGVARFGDCLKENTLSFRIGFD